MTQKQIEEAKKLLEDNGYFVSNLWHVRDVTDSYECSNETAQDVLFDALTNDATMQQIWLAIDVAADKFKLTKKEL